MIDNSIGRPVSSVGLVFGYIFLAGSAVLIYFFGIFPSILLLLVSLLIVAVVQRVQVDPVNKRLRSYISFLGIKKGKWEELNNFPFLCVLRKNKEEEITSINVASPGMSIKSIEYEICLLTENHTGRVLLKTVNQKEDALRIADEYAKQLKKAIVEYHPKRTSKRRR
jgi:hypothetical protein